MNWKTELKKYDELVFDPVKHTYTHRYSGLIFKGWSSMKKIYSAPFDPDGHIVARSAKKAGVTVAEMSAQWKKKSKDALDFGHKIHAGLESMYNQDGAVLDAEQTFWMEQVKSDARLMNRFKIGDAISEQVLYCTKSYMAGTTDLMTIENGRIYLGDFKTNAKIDFYNVFNNYLLYPFENIPDISGSTYALQLSVYMVLACRMTGLEPGGIHLIHLSKETKKLAVYTPALMLETAEKIISLAKNHV